MEVRRARAILITPENRLVLIKRKKPGVLYYVLPGGCIEDGETSQDAIVREIFEEVGSALIEEPVFLFTEFNPFDGNELDVYLAKEKSRQTPMGEEWQNPSEDNYYEVQEFTLDELTDIPIVPEFLKDKIISIFKDTIS